MTIVYLVVFLCILTRISEAHPVAATTQNDKNKKQNPTKKTGQDLTETSPGILYVNVIPGVNEGDFGI